MNRRNFVRSSVGALLIPFAPAIVTSKGAYAGRVQAFAPAFNPEPMMIASGIIRMIADYNLVRGCKSGASEKRKVLAGLKIDIAKQRVKLAKSLMANPRVPFRMDVSRGIMW